jgi:hypothetical protein
VTDLEPIERLAAVLTLTEFLLARIAEDEDRANLASATQWFTTHNIQGRATKQYGTLTAEFMIRWDPARVLAECEAKRQIVAQCVDGLRCDMECLEGHGGNFDDILGALALPYTDHPDYCEEWRP